MIIYKQEGCLVHRSELYVSNEPEQNASAVYSIMKKLVPIIKQLIPGRTFIGYSTDSPTLQYRNKYIFHLIANYEKTLNVSSASNYFESGHGEGLCDGIRGYTIADG